MSFRRPPILHIALCATVLAACGGGESEAPPRPRGDERTIATLQSYVYARPDDAPYRIAERVRDQVKSVLGGLKGMRVIGSNRAVVGNLEDKLYREAVILSRPRARDEVVVRVWFRYVDEVSASSSVPRGAPILVGALHRQDEAHVGAILTACTAGTARERDLKDRLQSAFDGSMPSCQDAILAEQHVIDAARTRLVAPDEEIVPEEMERIYLPALVRLEAVHPSQTAPYPRFEEVVAQPRLTAQGEAMALERRDLPGSGDTSDAPLDPAAVTNKGGDAPLVIPAAGAPDSEPQQRAAEPDRDPDAPPEMMVPEPVVVGAAQPPKGTQAVQPRGETASSFSWEDLGDKRFWVMWIALFALYPLLRRRDK